MWPDSNRAREVGSLRSPGVGVGAAGGDGADREAANKAGRGEAGAVSGNSALK